jgi:S-adenosyl methyltransferase
MTIAGTAITGNTAPNDSFGNAGFGVGIVNANGGIPGSGVLIMMGSKVTGNFASGRPTCAASRRRPYSSGACRLGCSAVTGRPGKEAAVTQDWRQGRTPDGELRLPAFDTHVPNPARMWNYWVGGKDNFAADREAADKVLEAMPVMPLIARLVRRFLIDVVYQLVDGYGIRQFLDIGTGLPTADNTHDVAQKAAPESRVVYVDHDPVVLSHARALLTSSPEGETDYILADLRDAGTIVAEAARTLDFSRPVAVLLIAVLHFIPDADDPYGIVRRLMDAVPSGSYLVISHAASDIAAGATAEMARRYNALSPVPITPRSREQVARFFDGLDMMPPGLVPLSQWWKSGPAEASAASDLAGYCGIGRKR